MNIKNFCSNFSPYQWGISEEESDLVIFINHRTTKSHIVIITM